MFLPKIKDGNSICQTLGDAQHRGQKVAKLGFVNFGIWDPRGPKEIVAGLFTSKSYTGHKKLLSFGELHGPQKIVVAW